MAKIEIMKVAMTIHRVGASAFTFFRMVFSMISPQGPTLARGLGPAVKIPSRSFWL
jgi:hypothetical protein